MNIGQRMHAAVSTHQKFRDCIINEDSKAVKQRHREAFLTYADIRFSHWRQQTRASEYTSISTLLV